VHNPQINETQPTNEDTKKITSADKKERRISGSRSRVISRSRPASSTIMIKPMVPKNSTMTCGMMNENPIRSDRYRSRIPVPNNSSTEGTRVIRLRMEKK